MLILAYGGRTPLGLSDGEGVVGVSTAPKNTIEKKIKKIIFFYAINFLFIYLHISKFLLTFASQ